MVLTGELCDGRLHTKSHTKVIPRPIARRAFLNVTTQISVLWTEILIIKSPGGPRPVESYD
jgi:hypothetical protein